LERIIVEENPATAAADRDRLIEKYVRSERYSGFESQANGLNHLAFAARDLDETIEFYTQVVGLKLLRVRPLDGDPASTMVFFDMGRGEFLAFLKLHDVKQPAARGTGGIHHFALTVDRQQYRNFKDRAEERGIKYQTISHEILDSISALDPNGVEVELSVWNIDPKDMQQE
jgi:catechol 2,3-dioxygenase-like lactoylglutathione lyase family enzyme